MHSSLLLLLAMPTTMAVAAAAAAARTDKPRLMWLPPLVVALLLLSGALLEAAAAAAGTSTTSADDAASSTSSLAAERAATGRRSRLLVASQSTFSLDSYGARGDGRHDDTQALARAWEAACLSPRPAVLLVPGGRRYLLKLVVLRGPCRSRVAVTVKGTLVASPNRADWSDSDRRHWIVFRSVDRLTLHGRGSIDGNGHSWWPHSCKINKALVV